VVRGLMINISETKQTEEALLLSEEKFAKAFHASLDGLLLSRQSDGLIIEINEGFSRLIGYDSASALYHSTLELQLWVDPQERRNLLAILEKTALCATSPAISGTRKGKCVFVKSPVTRC
jgi:hypothetical protein